MIQVCRICHLLARRGTQTLLASYFGTLLTVSKVQREYRPRVELELLGIELEAVYPIATTTAAFIWI
jgi:hypothetical protein